MDSNLNFPNPSHQRKTKITMRIKETEQKKQLVLLCRKIMINKRLEI